MNETQDLPTPPDVQRRRNYAAMEHLACLLLIITFNSDIFICDVESLETEIRRATDAYAAPNESLKRLVNRLAERLKVQYD